MAHNLCKLCKTLVTDGTRSRTDAAWRDDDATGDNKRLGAIDATFARNFVVCLKQVGAAEQPRCQILIKHSARRADIRFQAFFTEILCKTFERNVRHCTVY